MSLRTFSLSLSLIASLAVFCCFLVRPVQAQHDHAKHVQFSLRSTQDGPWSDPQTWEPQRLPKQGDRVLISSGTTVVYDVEQKEVIRLVQVVGTLKFAIDRDTELNVGLVTIQHDEACS